jgi:hypothetical protein
VLAKESLRVFALDNAGGIVANPDRPIWTTRDDGGVEGVMWIRPPSGIRRNTSMDKIRVQFSATAAMSRSRLEHRDSD